MDSLRKKELASIVAGTTIIILNLLFLPKDFAVVSPLINLAGVLVAFLPSFLHFYSGYRERSEIEEQFTNFVYDLSEELKTGMNLPLALKHCSEKNYLSLNEHVKKLAAQIDWGIPFSKALMMFAEKSKSQPIKRSVVAIIESYKVGGKITKTLESVSHSLRLIDRIKKERRSSVYSQIFTSYMIYFVFIFILIILQVFLMPALIPADELAVSSSIPIEAYSFSFIMFIIIQGFFAGLVTGKLSEGSVVAGLKHSVFLMAVGYTVFSMAVNLVS